MRAALSLSQIHKRYPSFALQNIDLRLETGQIMGLVGVNGAGKSTLLRILMGIVCPDQGEVEVLGFALPREQAQAKREIGFAAEDMRLFGRKSLRWHMDWIASIYPNWDEPYGQDLLRRFDLQQGQEVRGFSHGQRVKALLLLNLARRPKLLLLDEPTTGLDPVARSEVLETLAEVLRDESRSVLFSSHNTADIEQLCDSISFLHRGKMLASKDKDGFLQSWRRIIGQATASDALAQHMAKLPGVARCKQNGTTFEIKTSAYSEALAQQLTALGVQIQSVEAMNLEDIFVTTVRAGALQ